ncbi:MAG: TfoX/Sxy family protein [Ignavibacteriae bacterium]|nr:TfoX family protein [Ignavibacteriota bacterium]NOG98844.1 TfoX/Sxy family protein [Ignavibacteriota bacterium]
MAVNEEYLKLVIDQLSEFGEVEIKRMFGGIGLFHQGLMFGKIGGDTFRLKVDEHNQADYEEKGMKPFYSEKKKKGMPYWEVPIDVFKNKTELAKWATRSYEAAVRKKK